MGKKTDPSPFQCFCQATFETAAELLAHSMLMHPDPPPEKKQEEPKDNK